MRVAHNRGKHTRWRVALGNARGHNPIRTHGGEFVLLTCRGNASGPGSEYDLIVGNDPGRGVTWWVVPITLAIAAVLAWAVTCLEQTGRIKLN